MDVHDNNNNVALLNEEEAINCRLIVYELYIKSLTKVYIYADDWFYHIHAKYCISMTKHCMWKILPAFYTCTTNLSFNFYRIQLFTDRCLLTRPQTLLQLTLVTFYKVEEILTWLTWPKCCIIDVQVVKNRYNLLVVSKWENMGWQAYQVP